MNEDDHKKANNITYAQATSTSTMMMTTEDKRENTRSVKQSESINITEEPKRTYADIANSSAKVYDENEIFIKAIESAKKHKIRIKPGRKDLCYGNCVFKADVNNINNRDCFYKKLFQASNWYRRSWMDQIMDRFIAGICPWNPGYSLQQIREEFAKIKRVWCI